MMRTRGLALLFLILAPLGPGCEEGSGPSDPDDGVCAKICAGGQGGSAGAPGSGGSSGGSSGADTGSDCDGVPLELAFDVFYDPSIAGAADFAFLPEGNRALVAVQEGRLQEITVSGSGIAVGGSWKVPDDVLDSKACGLTNVLVDPEFADNGFVYLSYCISETVTRLVRVTLDGDELTDLQVIVETKLEQPTDEWHRFGSMGFEEDGETLWGLVGEHTDQEQAQNLENLQGSLFRVKPSRVEGKGGYEIPEGNFAEVLAAAMGGSGGVSVDPEVEVRPEIYAYGLRSPWRGTRDEQGRYIIGDVGNGAAEEIDLVRKPGQNLGWPIAEGPCRNGDCDSLTDPIAWYDHEDDHPYVYDDLDAEPSSKRAIWVGEIYPSSGPDPYCGLMDGTVPFGEYFIGFVRLLKIDTSGHVVDDVHVGHQRSVVSWKVAPDGHAFFLTTSARIGRARLVVPD